MRVVTTGLSADPKHLTDRAWRRGEPLFWLTVVLLAGAGSLASVRLASPLTVDEVGTSLLLFFLLPGALVLALAAWRRPAGWLASCAVPFGWLLIAREQSDPPLLWVVPVLTCLLISLAGRSFPPAGSRAHPRLAQLWLAGGVLSSLLAYAWPEPGRQSSGTRLLVFGLDGASWERIDALLAQERLPNFAHALANGHRARLRSLPSTLSPQVWTTIATGYSPTEHGAWDFAANRDQVKVGRIWDQLHLEGRSFGLCGWYFTWPPLPDLGDRHFVVPSPLAPAGDTHPEDFSFFWQIWTSENPRQGGQVNYLSAGLAAFRHGVRLSTLRRAVQEKIMQRLKPRSDFEQDWRSRALSAELQADICTELMRTRRPEFVALLFTQLDRISHKYWKFMEPEGFPDVTAQDAARYGGVIDNAYVAADRNLGRILRHCAADADLLIVSDHGFRAGLGQWAGSWCSIRSEPLLAALNLSDDLFATNVSDKLLLRPLRRTGPEAEALLAEVQATLSRAQLVGDPAPLLAIERDGASLVLQLAPRNAIPEHATIRLAGRDYPFPELIHAGVGAHWSGEHDPDGIYLLAGPAAARASGDDSLHVLDVAPTIAALLGLPHCPGWTGRPAVDRPEGQQLIMAEYPLPPEAGIDTTQVDESLREKLRAIGYVR